MRRFMWMLPVVLLASMSAQVGASSTNWQLVDAESAGAREQHLLVYSPHLKRVLMLGGRVQGGAAYVMSFDAAANKWTPYAQTGPKLGKWALLQDAVCDGDGKNVYLFDGRQLHHFDVIAKTWSTLGEPCSVKLTAPVLAHDALHDALILLGSSTELDQVGWMGGVAFSLKEKIWRPLVFGDEATRTAHDQRRTACAVLEELVGRLRHAWYRDPLGAGTEAEREAILEQCAALRKRPGLGEATVDVDGLVAQVSAKNLFEALKAVRALRRKVDLATEAASPVPPARRHAPVAVDPINKVLLLFGGDHDDYTTNDTWLLNLETRQWRRAQPAAAPAPRAGHGLTYLPQRKAFALWDGFRHNSSTGYRTFQATRLPQREVWLYDAKQDAWTLQASWPLAEKSLPTRMGHRNMGFFGYTSQPFPMAFASDGEDRLIFVGRGPKKSGKASLNGTSILTLAEGAAAAKPEGPAPNSRAERTGPFLASFCEVPDTPKPAGIEQLPANTWTALPAPPRKPYFGWRQLDYGTATWNPDADEILHWGGGHCDSSGTAVNHWSLQANRMVMSYDLDEPYGSNGGGPGGRSLLGRPWVQTHAYRSYGYDFKNKVMILLVSGKGKPTRLYDPTSMRWLAEAPVQPFDGHCYSAHFIPTPHGAVAWAGTRGHQGQDGRGVWVFDRASGWKELVKPGSAPDCRVDRSCSTYDSKRDRVLLLPGDKEGPNVYAVSMKNGGIEKLTPSHPEFGKVTRKEAVYVAHCDWVMLVQTVKHGETVGHMVYDCGKNRWMLLDAGPLTAKMPSPGRGLVYDAKRKLVYLITETGSLFALRIDPASAALATGD